jgi:hypothetical protein
MEPRSRKLLSVAGMLVGMPMAIAPLFAPQIGDLVLYAVMCIPGMPDLDGIGALILLGGIFFSFVLGTIGFAIVLFSLRRLLPDKKIPS